MLMSIIDDRRTMVICALSFTLNPRRRFWSEDGIDRIDWRMGCVLMFTIVVVAVVV